MQKFTLFFVFKIKSVVFIKIRSAASIAVVCQKFAVIDPDLELSWRGGGGGEELVLHSLPFLFVLKVHITSRNIQCVCTSEFSRVY